MNCIVCKGDNVKKLFVKQKDFFMKCSGCGVIFISQQFLYRNMKEYYGKQYYTPWLLSKEGIETTRRNKMYTSKKWLKVIDQYCKGGKILDIGCAMGFFLEVAQYHGWDIYGVEVSEYSSDIARNKLGNHITTGVLYDAAFKSESFDVVTMFDVIEHAVLPLELLSEVARILKPGGILAISTVNTKSMSCKILGVKWPHFKQEHLCYFSPSSIRYILHTAGFSTLEITKARKYLTLQYIRDYFEVYRDSAFTHLLHFIYTIFPKAFVRYPLQIAFGEIFVIAKKAIK